MVVIYNGSWNNLWSIKASLIDFESVSGLCVNIYKSKIYGIHLKQDFLQDTSTFLACKIGSIHFLFLRIPLGANPRYRETWISMLDKMRKRISSGKVKNLSFGGRVVMINTVLYNVPLHFYLCFKAPKVIAHEIIKVKHSFGRTKCHIINCY